MELKFIFLWIFLLSGGYLVKAHDLPDLTDTTPDVFPFHAVVHARMVCGGILISEQYVITPAYCVYGASNLKVYLGFKGYPYFVSHHSEPNTQVYTVHSNNIFIHEDFARVKDSHYLNNIAIIKLIDPVKITDCVRPGKLMSRQDTHLLEGRFTNISGWLVSTDEDLKYAKVHLRNQDTCGFLFGNQFLRSQELCVKWLTETRLNLLGNAVTVENKIIGFQTNTPPCAISSSTCTRNDMVLNFLPFLDWISYKTNIPLNKFTSSKSEVLNQEELLAKMERLDNRIEEVLNTKKTFNERYELDLKTLNEKIANTMNELERSKREQNSFALKLNEEISSIKTEINNTRVRNDQSIFKLQEEVNAARTEISNGLTAQRSLADLESKFQNFSDGVKLNIEEKSSKIEEQYRSVLNKTESFKVEVNERFVRQEGQILSLSKKLNEVDNREEKGRLELVERVECINSLVANLTSSFVNLSLDQFSSQEQINSIVGDFKIHLSKEHDAFSELEKKLVEIIDTVHNNLEKENLRFGEVEKLFGEQRNDFDTHVIKEYKEFHLLWVAIKSLNDSIHNIDEFLQVPYS